MRPDDVRLELRKQPFRPLRMYLSDGKYYDIVHPELAMVGISSVMVGRPAANAEKPFYDDYVVVALNHLTRIEPLPVGASAQTNGSAGTP